MQTEIEGVSESEVILPSIWTIATSKPKGIKMNKLSENKSHITNETKPIIDLKAIMI
jgi:hypothetical protein